LYQKFYLLDSREPCQALRSSTINGRQDGDKDFMRLVLNIEEVTYIHQCSLS